LLRSVTSCAQARYAALVIDADSGRVLYEVNADTRNYPASLTKMMTLYLLFEALEEGRLTADQPLTVSRRAAGMPASKLGLKRGQSIRVEDAILVLVTKSANDVAVVVAEAIAGKETQFARLMTRKAKALGMTRTNFRNASGLYHRSQLSTARDMAILAQALMRDFPARYKTFSTRSFTYNGRSYRNHNKLLRNYKGTDGLKTGYIAASGYNLAASAKRDGHRVIAVVFGGKTARSRDRQVAKLLDRGFRPSNQSGQTSDLTPSDHRQDVPQKPISDHVIAVRHEKSKVEPGKSTKNNRSEASFSALELPRQYHVLVHLASFRTANAAGREWERLKGRYPAQLADLELIIERVELGTQGIFYRVLTDLAEDRSSASRLCDSLRTVNQYCSVVKSEIASVL
jgi:D-alanyl-D-alanine carboxypeptidase